MNLDSLIATLERAERTPITAPAPSDPKLAAFLDQVEGIYTKHLPRVYPGWESRPQQIKMARAVATALYHDKSCAAEAGTGMGKALALLGPAVMYARRTGKPVAVSTGTHVLQEQYLRKDVPRLQEAIGRFSVALAKGKGNYLCLKRMSEANDLFGSIDEIIQWSEHTETGDRGELAEFNPQMWAQVCVDDSCTKSRCPHFQNCWLFKARRKMEEAQVIICNHALLVADIAVKHLTYGMGSLLPDHCAVILDEAHHLEDVARQGLGATLTQTRLQRILRDLKSRAPLIDAAAMNEAQAANDQVFAMALRLAGREDRREADSIDVSRLEGAVAAVKSAAQDEKKRAPSEDAADSIENVVSRLNTYLDDLAMVGTPSDERVVWVDVNRSESPVRVSIHASPVEVAGLLRNELFSVPVVCSSATLTTDRRFDYFRQSVGMPDDAHEFISDSPFDYKKNAILYVPRELPDPRRDDFHHAIAPQVRDLLKTTQGRAFVLCTSWQGVGELYEALRGLPYRVLRQGEMSRGALLDAFVEDTHSVLVATQSFWEGVDVPGDSLSCVVMTRLPFSVPDDPITKAKVRAIEARGGNAFMNYMVPEAVLKMRQGFGRLIRTQSDRGVVAMFDRRLLEARYGRKFLNSLPNVNLVRGLDDVARFLGEERVA